jgi:hypothetical protein
MSAISLTATSFLREEKAGFQPSEKKTDFQAFQKSKRVSMTLLAQVIVQHPYRQHLEL